MGKNYICLYVYVFLMLTFIVRDAFDSLDNSDTSLFSMTMEYIT